MCVCVCVCVWNVSNYPPPSPLVLYTGATPAHKSRTTTPIPCNIYSHLHPVNIPPYLSHISFIFIFFYFLTSFIYYWLFIIFIGYSILLFIALVTLFIIYWLLHTIVYNFITLFIIYWLLHTIVYKFSYVIYNLFITPYYCL